MIGATIPPRRADMDAMPIALFLKYENQYFNKIWSVKTCFPNDKKWS